MAIKNACAVTGYKPFELGIFSVSHPSVEIIKYSLRSKIIQMMDEGIEWFVISGQTGIELWTGEVIQELKKEDLPVKLAVLLPFLNQEERWPDTVKNLYQQVLEQADFVDAVSKRGYESPRQFQQKNAFIALNTACCLLVYDEEAPGSPQYFLSVARQKAEREAYTINMITRFDLEDAEQELRMQDPSFWAE